MKAVTHTQTDLRIDLIHRNPKMKPSRLEILVVSLMCLVSAALLVGWMFGPALENAVRAAK
jgi:hypothetical protein